MSTFEHGHAVVVGVGGSLAATLQDARAVASLLRDPGRCAYRESNVEVLLESSATREGIVAALERMADRTSQDPQSTAIFYFSGHGVGGSEPYLIPHGCEPSSEEEKLDKERLQQLGLSSAALSRVLSKIQARKMVVFLDCCYAAGLVKLELQADAKSVDLPSHALREFLQGSGRVVLASSTSAELSWTQSVHSVFTEALLEGLAGYGAIRRDGYSRIFDITNHVQRAVRRRTRGEQNPILKADDLDEDIALAYYAAGELEPKALGLSWPLPTVARAESNEEERRLYLTLEEKRQELVKTEAAIGRLEAGAVERNSLEKEERRLDKEIAELEGRLGILPQQSSTARSLSRLWSRTGTFTLLFSLALWSATQGGPTQQGLSQIEGESLAVYGLLLGGPCLFLVLHLTGLYAARIQRRGWAARLPVAFLEDLVFTDRNVGRQYQALFLVAFLLVPMAAQIHFLDRVKEATIFEDSTQAGSKQVWKDTGLRRLDHWRTYYPAKVIFGDKYRIGSERGITFFPFWAHWLFLLSLMGLSLRMTWVLGLLYVPDQVDQVREVVGGLLETPWRRGRESAPAETRTS
ncbi:MAG TPA: caspase family protein [Thermoanaerobaculia bacterium]|nr:caspase family protein [Thermoanaerobaculia bacterium]